METPKDVIEERQHALAGPDGAPISKREITRLTERFKGGPIGSSTLSRWSSPSPGRAQPQQLEIFARATATSDMPWERVLDRIRSAFGSQVDSEPTPWEPPPDVDLARDLDASQKRWLTETVRMLKRTNERLTLEARQSDGEDPISNRGAGQQ